MGIMNLGEDPDAEGVYAEFGRGFGQGLGMTIDLPFTDRTADEQRRRGM